MTRPSLHAKLVAMLDLVRLTGKSSHNTYTICLNGVFLLDC